MNSPQITSPPVQPPRRFVPPPPTRFLSDGALPSSPPLKLSVSVPGGAECSEVISPTPVVITAFVRADGTCYSHSPMRVNLECPEPISLQVSSDEDKEDDAPETEMGQKVRNYTPNFGPYHFGVEPSTLQKRVVISTGETNSFSPSPSPPASLSPSSASSSTSSSTLLSPDTEALRAHNAIHAFSPQYENNPQRDLHRFAIDERFQAVMELPESTPALQLQKYRQLSQLSADFMLQARQHGRTIISEMFLPIEDRTIKPVTLKGLAGGTKFVHQGILFKLAVDKLKSPESNEYIYGGNAPSFEDAQEACGHDLKGAINYYRFHHLGVHVPIQATVDFWGYKLSAMPFLRLAQQSLIYGSDDGGETVHADHPPFNAVMRKVATQLHLASHSVCGVRLDAAGDIEGHLGENGRVYLLDLARTFPPEHPLASTHLVRPPQSVFYCFLRPEFLQLLKQRGCPPLSPDSLTGWGNSDPNRRENAQNLFDATKLLFEEVIPAFAAARDGLKADAENRLSLRCQAAFHSAGINVRHAGLVRSCFKCPQDRKVLLMEMVARVLKNILRRWFRIVARDHPNSEYKIREVLLVFLNLVSKPGPRAVEFWRDHVTPELLQKFGDIALEPHEKLELFAAINDEPGETEHATRPPSASIISFSRKDVRPALAELIIYVAEMTGVHFFPNCLAELARTPSFEFCAADIASMEPRTKHMSIVNFADAQLLAHQAKLSENSIEICLRLLNVGCGHLHHALQSDPLNDEIKTAFVTSEKMFQVLQMEIGGECEQADLTFLRGVREVLRKPTLWSLKIARHHLTALVDLWTYRLNNEQLGNNQSWGAATQRNLQELAEVLRLWEQTVLETCVKEQTPPEFPTRQESIMGTPEKLPGPIRLTLKRSSMGFGPTPRVALQRHESTYQDPHAIVAMKDSILALITAVATKNLGLHNKKNTKQTLKPRDLLQLQQEIQTEIRGKLLAAMDTNCLAAGEFFLHLSQYHVARSNSGRLAPLLASVDEKHARTPLFTAVEKGREEFVTFLIREGSDLEYRDLEGNTPFLFACKHRLFPMMSLLARCGANIYAEIPNPVATPHSRKATALDLAESKDDGAMIQHFRTLQQEADKVEHMLERRTEIVQEMIKRIEADVDDLEFLVDFFLAGLQKDCLLKQKQIDQIFGNVSEICSTCLMLLAATYKVGKSWNHSSSLSELFETTLATYVRLIPTYCGGINSGLRLLESVSTPGLQKALARYAESGKQHLITQKRARADLSLPALLEVPRAQLVYLTKTLARALDFTPPGHSDYVGLQALCARFSQTLEAAILEAKAVDNDEKVALLEQQFNTSPGFLEPSRFLLKEGILTKKSRKADHRCHFFVFTDMIAYATKTFGRLRLRRTIPFDCSFQLRDQLGNNDRTFTLISAHKSFVIVTESVKDKQDWMIVITQAVSALQQDTSASGLDTVTTRPVMEQANDQTECPLCKHAFSWHNRRNHCHLCGIVVCRSCSRNRKTGDSERVCTRCVTTRRTTNS